jgi:hypothetical protein
MTFIWSQTLVRELVCITETAWLTRPDNAILPYNTNLIVVYTFLYLVLLIGEHVEINNASSG